MAAKAESKKEEKSAFVKQMVPPLLSKVLTQLDDLGTKVLSVYFSVFESLSLPFNIMF